MCPSAIATTNLAPASSNFCLPAFNETDVCVLGETCMFVAVHVNVHTQQHLADVRDQRIAQGCDSQRTEKSDQQDGNEFSLFRVELKNRSCYHCAQYYVSRVEYVEHPVACILLEISKQQH